MTSPLGPKVKRPAPPTTPADAWRPVPGKPHLYVDAQGRMKYAPPTPSVSSPSPWPWPNYAVPLARPI